MPRTLTLAIATIILVHVAAIHASADPVRVVSGTLSFDTGDPPSFRLMTSSGQLVEAEGFRLDWPAICFFECSPGATIPLSSTSTTQFDGSMVFFADGVEAALLARHEEFVDEGGAGFGLIIAVAGFEELVQLLESLEFVHGVLAAGADVALNVLDGDALYHETLND